MDLHLGATLSLTCNFIGVPAPMIFWFLNDTHLLDPLSNPRITVANSADHSVLIVTDLQHDEVGKYSCFFNNTRGMDVGLITITLNVLSKLFPSLVLAVVPINIASVC